MLDYLSRFTNFTYWFASYPDPFQGRSFKLMAGGAIAGVVVGVVVRLLAGRLSDPSNRKILKRLSMLAITTGVLVAISFFFTQTSTPILGSRFWFGLWFIMDVVWLGFIVRYALLIAPKERAERAQVQAYQKYLPHGAK